MLLLACADGAGSASRSEIGSSIACRAVLDAAEEWLGGGNTPADLKDADLEDWFLEAIRQVTYEAERMELRPRELACTLLFALVGETRSAFAQLGDGAIVLARGDDYEPVFWPQSGEYANQTYFITDAETLTRVQYDRYVGPIEEVALFTDGIQNIALVMADQTAHSPFFRPFFSRLRQEDPGERQLLCRALEAFLSSPPVNERTDDDKTLVVATRRYAVSARPMAAPSVESASDTAEQEPHGGTPTGAVSSAKSHPDEPTQAG